MDIDLTEKQLNELEYYGGGISGMIKLAKSLFNTSYGSWSTVRKPDEERAVHQIVTGGWSQNEAVVDALSRTMFHSMGWLRSTRGGAHAFEQLDSWSTWADGFWGNPFTQEENNKRLATLLSKSLEEQGLELSRKHGHSATPAPQEEVAYWEAGGLVEGSVRVHELRVAMVAQSLRSKLS